MNTFSMCFINLRNKNRGGGELEVKIWDIVKGKRPKKIMRSSEKMADGKKKKGEMQI